jgi:hypothetical protein
MTQFRLALQRLIPWLPDARDLHVYGGGLLIAIGAWQLHPAAGWIVMGALLVGLGLRSR